MKAALFDLDGVIIDTEGTYSRFWSMIGEKYGFDGLAFSNKIKGTTLADILNSHFPKEMHADIVAQLTDFEENMQYPLFDGTLQLLKELRMRGLKTAIVTSSGSEKMSRLWKQHPGLREMFDVVITDADVTRSKPDPQGYLLAAARCGAMPQECWVFEDSYNGLKAARNSGARVVALATTNPAETLTDKADIVANTITDIAIGEITN